MDASHSGDVIDVLLEQHAHIKRLFATLRDSTGDDRKPTFEDLVALLHAHEAAEQRVVHPVVRDAVRLRKQLPVERLRLMADELRTIQAMR